MNLPPYVQLIVEQYPPTVLNEHGKGPKWRRCDEPTVWYATAEGVWYVANFPGAQFEEIPFPTAVAILRAAEEAHRA